MENEFYKLGKNDLFQVLATSEKGLSTAEAKDRLDKYGKNVFEKTEKFVRLKNFFSQFKDLLILILLFGAILSIVVAIIDKDYVEYINAGIIFFVVILNACIGFIQEEKADKAMERLKAVTRSKAKVIRDNKIVKVKMEDLVVGDIVVFEAGDSIPADLRIIEYAGLKIEESSLTGESLAVEKNSKIIDKEVSIADRKNMAFMGTTVVYGRGKGIVVATGKNTEMGKIAHLLRVTKKEQTPLTKKVTKTSIIISFIVIVVALFIFLLGVIKGDDISTSLVLAVAIAVCAVPEGLPACVTITLSLGVSEMAKKRAIVKNLTAVETLGSTEIICSDKTGTLTMNKMVVKQVYINNKKALNKFKKETDLEKKSKQLLENEDMFELLRCMLLCNDSQLKFEDDYLTSIGDPTEVALSEFGYKYGVIKENFDGKFVRVDEKPFDSNRKLMTTLNRVGNEYVSYTKGAVDKLLLKCNKILINGKVERLTQKRRDEIIQCNAEMGANALRVLGFAKKKIENIKKDFEYAEEDLIFIGLVGMIDPPRPEVFESIKICKKAGITPIMITGDHRDTAFAIAKELDITNNEKQVITGVELDKLSKKEFLRAVSKYRVYARVSPENKVMIVDALKQNGKIVAMTGDGVNDAPSLKRADIGVGMGITGTDVTKEAADMILTDDNFATIVGAVKEGRRIYNNISKVIQYLLGTSFAELIILTILLSILRQPFFTPMLILWFNLVSDTLVALALGVEKEERDVMNEKPRNNKGSLFHGKPGFNLVYSAIVASMIVFGVYFLGTSVLNLSAAEVTTMSFITLLVCELLHAYNLKSDINSIFNKNIFKNKWLNWGFIISLLLSVILLLIPSVGLRELLGVSSLSFKNWCISIGFAFIIIPMMEIEKFILRCIERRKKKKKDN